MEAQSLLGASGRVVPRSARPELCGRSNKRFRQGLTRGLFGLGSQGPGVPGCAAPPCAVQLGCAAPAAPWGGLGGHGSQAALGPGVRGPPCAPQNGGSWGGPGGLKVRGSLRTLGPWVLGGAGSRGARPPLRTLAGVRGPLRSRELLKALFFMRKRPTPYTGERAAQQAQTPGGTPGGWDPWWVFLASLRPVLPQTPYSLLRGF